jgi:hypothetical protein
MLVPRRIFATLSVHVRKDEVIINRGASKRIILLVLWKSEKWSKKSPVEFAVRCFSRLTLLSLVWIVSIKLHPFH